LYQALWSSYEGVLKNDKQLNERTWKKAKYLIESNRNKLLTLFINLEAMKM